MRKIRVLFGMLFMVFVLYSVPLVSAAATIEIPITSDEDYTMARELLDRINATRTERYGEGHELQMDAKLQDIAMMRAAELAICDAHIRPDGSGLDIGGEYNSIKNENLAAGQGSAAGVQSDWESDPLHKGTMYDKEAYYCGIGCVYNEGTRYWVLETTIEPMSSPATTTGIKRNVTRNIATDPSKIQLFVQDWHFDSLAQEYTGSQIFYNKKGIGGRIGIFSKNMEDNRFLGFRIPPEMLTYSSNDPGVLTITSSGVVTPVSTGSTTINVSLKNCPSVQAALPVTVLSNVKNGMPTMTFLEGEDFNGTKRFYQTGSPIQPKVKVVDCYGSVLEEGVDYYLEYGANTNIGLGTVKAVFINNYVTDSGVNSFVSNSFYILPAATTNPTDPGTGQGGSGSGGFVSGGTTGDGNTGGGSTGGGTTGGGTTGGGTTGGGYTAPAPTLPKASLSSLKSAKKKTVTVKWKKIKGVSGYQIQYAMNKKFTKANKIRTLAKAKKTSLIIKKLKSQKTYYVRIRTYKKVNGVSYYGSWSKSKKVRIK